jgi:hypothetical protein
MTPKQAEIIEKHKWKKGIPSPNPKGRPKKLFTHLSNTLQNAGYQRLTPQALTEAIELLLTLPQSEIKAILQNDDAPIVYKVIIKGLLSQRGIDAMEKLLDRIYGKPKQSTEFGTKDGGNVRFVLEVEGTTPPPLIPSAPSVGEIISHTDSPNTLTITDDGS